MNISVNSGDGNSIFEIAAKFQQMQLRELSKNIETIKQKLRSGEDTGSIKFIDDMDKLNGLILQLRVKTNFTISENLDVKIEEQLDGLVKDNVNEINDIVKELEEDETQSIKLFNDRLKAYKTLDDIDERFLYLAALKAYATTIDNKTAIGKINEEISNIAREYKSEITNTMSKDAFEKLNKVSDTIPNILSQITGLAIFLSRILKANFQTWSTEITNDDLSNLIDTAKENLTTYISMSNNDGIQPYKSIFSKNMKPLENINEFVSSMGETAGVKSSDLNTKNQFKYINLMDYVNRDNISNTYTPNFNYDVGDVGDDDDIDDETVLRISKFNELRRIIEPALFNKDVKKPIQLKINELETLLKASNITYDLHKLRTILQSTSK